MSKSQTIARLESLLDRVRSRATAPRAVRSVEIAVAPPPVASAVAVKPAPAVDEAPHDLHVAAEAPLPPSPPPPPVIHEPPPRAVPALTEPEIVMEVEVQAATQETVIAVPVEDEAAAGPEALDSRERLVTAEPVVEAPALELSAAPEPEPELDVAPPPAVEIEASPELLVEPEAIEEAPASSRRPVALQPPPEERLAEMAFGAEEPQPARHTPPPESGRLPAAPEVEFDGDITGVRDAAKPAAPVELVPEATIADLAPSDAIADVVGRPKSPVPSTFVAVLDASIAL